MPDSHPRRAVRADLRSAAGVLAGAFAEDLALAHVLPAGVPQRDVRLWRFFAQELRRSIRLGGAWVTADGSGAAVWYPPGRWRPGTWDSLRSTPGALRVFGRHSRRAARVAAALHERHPVEPHWYLAYVGTRHHGAGVGTALLRAVLERCDADGLPAYLEASNQRNRALYLRHGFVDLEPLALPDGGPTVHLMWRDPR